MSKLKDLPRILSKFQIKELNAMQLQALETIPGHADTVLLSPTGTGKTLAFLLPIISMINFDLEKVQVLILVPSRELAIQIEQVVRSAGTGLKTNAVYGGRNISKDVQELKHAPHVLVGTPGRVAHHVRKGTLDYKDLETLVLDEFDKSLEIGFEEEMKDIIAGLPHVRKRVLTSATQGVDIPPFIGVRNPEVLDYLKQAASSLVIKQVMSPIKDKLDTLINLLGHLGNGPGIVFCNYKDHIQRVSDRLTEEGIQHGCFYGGIEQQDRERVLIKFRNGTHNLIVATDLAARGLDIPEIGFIIHYHLPLKQEEFTHRNGRTARMNADGAAYVLRGINDKFPHFMGKLDTLEVIEGKWRNPQWATLFISGGRKDKISKGDIAGVLIKQAGLKLDDVGVIELKSDCAFVGVKSKQATRAVEKVNNTRIKKKKVRVTLI